MNKEEKLEKNRVNNYEILCIVRDYPEEKSSLVEKIKGFTLPEGFTLKSEIKKLAYPIEKMKTAEYLLLNFRAERGKIIEIEKVLKNPLVVRHLTINLSTEKKIRIKNLSKQQKNKKDKKIGFKTEKTPQGKFNKEIFQENKSQKGTNHN